MVRQLGNRLLACYTLTIDQYCVVVVVDVVVQCLGLHSFCSWSCANNSVYIHRQRERGACILTPRSPPGFYTIRLPTFVQVRPPPPPHCDVTLYIGTCVINKIKEGTQLAFLLAGGTSRLFRIAVAIIHYSHFFYL